MVSWTPIESRKPEVDLLKKEYTSFVSDNVHGNPRALQEFKEYDKVCSVLTVSWPHTLKTAIIRSCGIFSTAFLFCSRTGWC